MRVRLPNNWIPRSYQRPLWDYLENGGKRAIEIAHRRWGKDEVILHRTAIAAHERVATYWHCLPEYEQARKAIWNAVNPHTGKRRIDEAFPEELRASKDEQQMFIRFKNGSTWQVIGSDRYNALVGAGVAGVTFSEWALCNPSAWGYIRPMIEENDGWASFITTPRGRNHAKAMYEMAKDNPKWFAEISSVNHTGALTEEQLLEARAEYQALFGIDHGIAQFEQEYMCSFEAAIPGAIYGGEISDARQWGRVREVEYDPIVPVYVVFDIGMSDDTAIIWFQMVNGEIHVIDAYATNGKPIKHYVDILDGKPYKYATMGKRNMVWLPHDARAKTFAANGKSTQQQFEELGWDSLIVPSLSVQDGIQAARKSFPVCYFDETKCYDLLDALSQYQREWDDTKKCFKDSPRHDWTSHFADAFRYLAIVWKVQAEPKAPQPARFDTQLSIDEIIKRQTRKRLQES